MECRELTCISCPMGCQLTVAIDDETITVSGNGCKIGVTYGQNEIRSPKRMVTTSVNVTSCNGSRMMSVKTSDVIPKDKIGDCLRVIKEADIQGEFSVGDVVIANILNLGVDIVATRAIK